EENLKMELVTIRNSGKSRVFDCTDNDETASVITTLVKARLFVILTSVNGIYKDIKNPDTLIKEIGGKNADEVIAGINEAQQFCVGASREGANGAESKLKFAIEPVKQGTKVIIANAKFPLKDILDGTVERTVIGVR
ncbi:MAG: uridylate kinase, partial [Clostridia bacterium]|nr:uridylate kinase [Clostridia bacterium]